MNRLTDAQSSFPLIGLMAILMCNSPSFSNLEEDVASSRIEIFSPISNSPEYRDFVNWFFPTTDLITFRSSTKETRNSTCLGWSTDSAFKNILSESSVVDEDEKLPCVERRRVHDQE